MDEVTNFIDQVSFRDGGWVFLIPCSLMCFDILTGVIHAWATGHLKSYRMREGLGRKAGEVSVLAIGQIFESGLNLPVYILYMFSFYIIIMELISICENLDKMGFPIPAFVKKALASAKNEIQNGSEKDGENDDSDESETTDETE